MAESKYGRREGLDKRLAYWANQLGRDRQYPWVGTGLIDDLKAAAEALGTDFDTNYPAVVEEDEFAEFRAKQAEAAKIEYDL